MTKLRHAMRLLRRSREDVVAQQAIIKYLLQLRGGSVTLDPNRLLDVNEAFATCQTAQNGKVIMYLRTVG